MPEWLTGAFEFLVNMNMHPMVTAVVFLVLLVSRVVFEGPHIQAAKDAVADAAKASPDQAGAFMLAKASHEQRADRIESISYVVAFLLSLSGQFALYWPRSGQARVLCAFFSFAQFALALVAVWFVDKFGLIDRLGRFAQKKTDEKLGA